MNGYRPDIDGLRTVAVMPVVLFHANVSGLSGGFVGVDIFFVISGFLITTIIQKEITAGTFSLVRFYERRARRLLPALFAVILATLVAGYFLSMPGEFENIARSTAWVLTFVSNFYFWSKIGYFAPGVYELPFLHTWSLAIEEQFYIFFPLLLMLVSKLRRNPKTAIAVLTVASFALSALTTSTRPDAAYYLLPWRAWELGVGALIALYIKDVTFDRATREILSLVGLAAIAYAVLYFDETTVFPGAAAMLPVAGAGLLLLCGGHGDTFSDRFLSWSPMVWIGLISYSLYLWHWPVILFYQHIVFDRPDLLGAIVIVVLSVALAWLSWKYVEAPFRSHIPSAGPSKRAPRFSRAKIFSMSFAGMIALFALSGAIRFGDGWPWRLPPEATQLVDGRTDRHPRAGSCMARNEGWRSPKDPCIVGAGDDAPVVALWGDSHGIALLPEVDAAANRANVRAAFLSRAGCVPVENVERLDGRTGRCVEYGNGAMEYILETKSLTTVILVARYAMSAEGFLVDYGLAERDVDPTLFADAEDGLWPEEERLDRLIASLDKAITRMTDAGLTVAIIYPIPEIGHKVPQTLARLSLQGRNYQDFGVSYAFFQERNAEIMERLDEIVERTGAIVIKSDEILCDEEICRAYRDGHALYYDDDHLNGAGSALFAAEFDAIMAKAKSVDRAMNLEGTQ